MNDYEVCLSRYLPNEPQVTTPPAMYLDPADQMLKPTTELSTGSTLTQPWQSQLGHLTVTKVEETTDPVTHDYL